MSDSGKERGPALWLHATPDDLTLDEQGILEYMSRVEGGVFENLPKEQVEGASHDVANNEGGSESEEAPETSDVIKRLPGIESFAVMMAIKKVPSGKAYGQVLLHWLQTKGIGPGKGGIDPQIYVTLGRLAKSGIIKKMEKKKVPDRHGISRHEVVVYELTPKGEKVYSIMNRYLQELIAVSSHES